MESDIEIPVFILIINTEAELLLFVEEERSQSKLIFYIKKKTMSDKKGNKSLPPNL